MFIGLALYEAFSVACIFATTIDQLLILRCIQGLINGATVVCSQAIIADVFAPHERGTAMGIYFTPLLLGPIIAPIIGGFLTDAYGWRSTFMFLAVLALPISLVGWFVLPESHQYVVMQSIAAKGHTSTSKAEDGKENQVVRYKILPAEAQVIRKPVLMMPWEPLAFLFEKELAVYYAAVFSTFCIMFVSMTTLPIALSVSPYNLSAANVGLTFIPFGVSMLVGSQWGGKWSDSSAMRYSHVADGRMVYTQVGLWMVPLGGIAFGITLQYGAHLAAVLLTQCILGFGQAWLMPATIGYLSTIKPNDAASAGSVQICMCFVAACVGVSVSVPIADAIGIAWFYGIMSLVTAAVGTWTSYTCMTRVFGTPPPVVYSKGGQGADVIALDISSELTGVDVVG
jgi:MFS family permease